MPDVLLAIDGNSLMHRAYWALPEMHDHLKRPTHAIYGFFSMVFKIVEEYAPSHMVVAFDMKEKTFRHDVYSEYKAGRRKTPDDLNAQFPLLKEALALVGIKYVESEGYEADDLIGAFSQEVHGSGINMYIFTGDKDELQLISDDVFVVLTKKGVSETKFMDKAALMEEQGLRPMQIIDLKGLMGDSSDNIPGIAGVGEKTALKLLHEYDTVENLYEHIEELPKNKLYEKLISGKEMAFLSKQLATIDKDAPIGAPLSHFAFAGFSENEIKALCEEFSFKAFLKRFSIEGGAPKKEEKTVEKQAVTPAALDSIEKAERFAFHLGPEGFEFAVGDGKDYIIKTKQTLIDDGYDEEEILKAAAPYFAEKEVVGHDIKKAMHHMAKFDVKIKHYFDSMLCDWVLDPSHSKYDFASVMERNGLPQTPGAILALSEKQRGEIDEKKLGGILNDIELPLLEVLYKMEAAGFYVSRDELESLGQKYDGEITKLTAKIYELADEEFNIGSTKQLAAVLFEKLGLPPQKKTKTGYSTDVEVLEALADKHEIIGYILEYRALAKLKSTYIDGLLALIQKGRIHTTFLQTATATGRLSSVEPNLQNIPIKSAMAADIRNAFVAPAGFEIMSADYSQIELRILAHLADDKNMIEAFETGEDIHARTAAEVLNKDIGDVTSAERASAKATNFGIVYGISDYGLARNSGMSRKRAGEYIKRYLEEFSGVRRYMDEIKKQAHKDLYVRTLFGRIRYIPELASSNFNIRSAGERAALNTPVQGSAADIIKIAMNRASDEIKKQKLKSYLVLQVHDELIAYVHDGEHEVMEKLLRSAMESAASLKVPLEVNIAAGHTWAEAK